MEKIKGKRVLGIVFIAFVVVIGMYISMNLDAAAREAKKYIESNQTIAKTIGPIRYSFVWPFYSNKIHVQGCRSFANLALASIGNESGYVYVKLIMNKAGSWEVQRASLLTKDSHVIVLKDGSDVSEASCQN